MAENNEVTGPFVSLRSGLRIPQVGFGTFQIPQDCAQEAVESALSAGYRHVDTAAAYYNEEAVGRAFAACGIPRSDFFVSGKLRNVDQGRSNVRQALERTLSHLNLVQIDLYMIHWPVPSGGLYVESFEAMLELQGEGLVKEVGVCNFLPEHLENLENEVGVLPAVNQLEIHPTYSQPSVREWNASHGVVTEAYSPLGQGRDLHHSSVVAIADELGMSSAEVILAWHISSGRVVIPKSVNPQRMAANLAAGGRRLSAEQVAILDALTSPDGRIGGDPATFAFPQTLEDIAARTRMS